MKTKYHHLCSTEPSIPIFSQDWWLDTVCGKERWDVLLVEEKEKIVAALPFYQPISGVISMPYYTQTMGPWLAPSSADTKYERRLSHNQVLCQQLIDQLGSPQCFLQNFSVDITDWLPFYWAGFRQTTRYTYRLHNIQQSDRLWNGLSLQMRRHITGAKEKHHITVRKGIPIDDFLSVQQQTFERQQLHIRSDNTIILRRLIETCRQRGQGDLWGGYDPDGRLHAAAFVVWQPNAAWYIAGGGDPALRSSNAHSLVLWECIHQMANHTNTFDFEGSMLPGVERFFRAFGAIQTPFFTITKGKLSLLDRIRIRWTIHKFINEGKTC